MQTAMSTRALLTEVPRLSADRQVRQGTSFGGMAFQRKETVGRNSLFRHGEPSKKNWRAH